MEHILKRWVIRAGEDKKYIYWAGRCHGKHRWTKNIEDAKIYNHWEKACKMVGQQRSNQMWLNGNVQIKEIKLKVAE